VRERSKDATKNFALNAIGFPMRYDIADLLYALLVVCFTKPIFVRVGLSACFLA